MKDYIEQAIRTESVITGELVSRLIDDARLLHGAIGIVTESGELMDALKKHVYYGANLDKVNIKEELGDLMWYIAILCDELEVDFDSLQKTNIEKLRARYPEKFSTDNAVNRDLEIEREILEDGDET